MAQMTFPVTQAGLEVTVLIGVDGTSTAALSATGQPISRPTRAQGTLDTGASVTSVASWVLRQLPLQKVTSRTTHTASGPASVDLYRVSLSIIDPARPGGPTLVEPDLLISELPTLLPDADVLIGLDVLLGCRLHLDGPARHFTLDF
jgi:hypothetical protein